MDNRSLSDAFEHFIEEMKAYISVEVSRQLVEQQRQSDYTTQWDDAPPMQDTAPSNPSIPSTPAKNVLSPHQKYLQRALSRKNR